MKPHRSGIAAAIWGFAEATIFFIVPDVLLSWVALRYPRRAFQACLWALGGALLGGVMIWYLGSADPEPVREFYATIPAISEAMIAGVRGQLDTRGLTALFIGPMIGTPYKIYALEAAGAGFGLISFLLISIPARLLRFVVVTGVVAVVSRALQPFVALRWRQAILVASWIGFYGFYFRVMSAA